MIKQSAKASALQAQLDDWATPDDKPALDFFAIGMSAMDRALSGDTDSRTITNAARVAAAALIAQLPEDGAQPPEYERGRRACRLYLYASALEAEKDRRSTPELKKLVITTRGLIRGLNALCRAEGATQRASWRRDEALKDCALGLAHLSGIAYKLRSKRLSDLVWRVYGAAHAYAVGLNREVERRDPPPRCFDGSPALSSLRLYLAQVAVGDAKELSELRSIMRAIRDADGMS